jgi:radical SAM protein with 4Fe4S-binding SPASM domain
MDVFDYSDHFFYRLARWHDISRPVQIELHPGIHCDLYRCPFCYGHGQQPLPGPVLSPEEIGAALDQVAASTPTVIVSGVTTEPLTHPQAAAVLTEVKRRGLPLGLYTKGRRLEGDVVDALLEGSGECWVTVSVDDIGNDEYLRRHNISPSSREGASGVSGAEYYERVLSNIRTFKAMRDARGAAVEIRIALLLFADSSEEAKVIEAVEALADLADRLRIAFPQDRNDGIAPGPLPCNRAQILLNLSKHLADHPKVSILQNTSEPQRNRVFNRCRVQQFQAVIDKSGNVFPCPQVAVGPYRHLSYGNIHQHSFAELLLTSQRRRMFEMDVDSQMHCRICDRKDETVNVALHNLVNAYE